MAENIKIERDQKIIKVLAAQARKERVDSNVMGEADEIVKKLAEDMSPQNMHELGQIISFSIDELQQNALNFMETFADVRNVALGDRPMYNVKTKGIKAFIQATGATTARSYITDRQFSINTFEISSRPAINIWDIRMGRIDMPYLIRLANEEFTNIKLKHCQKVLQAGITAFGAPWYGTGIGIVQQTLDAQLTHFKRVGNGNVVILGDRVDELLPATGVNVNATTKQYSGNMLDEYNNNGYLGRYRGAAVQKLQNALEDDGITPVLNIDWLYILTTGISKDQMNLKALNEGPVYSMTQQTIDDHTFETEVQQRFGAAFVVGNKPYVGAYEIG